MSGQRLVLASTSATRAAMLASAGVPHEVLDPRLDEEAAKASLRGDGLDARALADALAELKAVKLSSRLPGVLVLGGDTTLALDDGTMLDKPADRSGAARQLRTLSGRRHSLFSAAVVAENGVPVWRHVEVARMHVRPLSDGFVETYLEAEADWVTKGVGGYRVEGLGAQLFTRIEGSHFAVLGLPLLPLLGWLRTRGVVAA